MKRIKKMTKTRIADPETDKYYFDVGNKQPRSYKIMGIYRSGEKFGKENEHNRMKAEIFNWAMKMYKKVDISCDMTQQERVDGFNQALDYLIRKLKNL